MAHKDRILDDIARVAGGTASILSGLQQNIREDVKARVEEVALRLDLVPREDFDRLQMTVEALEKRIEELEKKAPPKNKSGKK